MNDLQIMMFRILIFFLGASLGSFLQRAVTRHRNPVLKGKRSQCDHCQYPLHSFHLIPILGFFLSKGRCQQCLQSISPWYPLFEWVTGAGLLIIWILIFEKGV